MHYILSKFNFTQLCFILIIYCLCILFLQAETYYISVSGSDAYGTGSYTSPWATFAKAFDLGGMKSGDTLIIKDGIYTDLNMIISRTTLQPPKGSENAWTIIKAEHDGEAVIDGSNFANTMFNLDYIGFPRQDRYWQFEGIIWQKTNGTNVNINNTRYIKFLRCGGCDASSGNNGNFSTGNGAEYILFENCYAYGSGRYKFVIFESSHCIIRQCVGRNDRADPQNTGPIATFAAYSSQDIEIQNCISVDCDQLDSYVNYYQLAGCFYVPCTASNSRRINITNCVGINSQIGAVWIDGTDSFSSSNIYIYNSVFWNCSNKLASQYPLCSVRGYDNCFTNCTFGSCRSDYYNINSYDAIGYDNETKIKNSIFYSIDTTPSTSNFNDVEIEDYNCLYRNSLNYLNTLPGANTKFNINPIYSAENTAGALKYPVRIERCSNLALIGEGGKDIGANCLNLIGKNGSLWGETDYNTEQGEMWPFPNEALIRAKMKAYSGGGVSGDRGFCAGSWTLTKYIWEAIGNTAPESFLPVNAPSNLSAVAVSSNIITLSWTDNASNESSFKVERKTGLSGTYSQIAELAVNTLNYENTGLDAAATYYYRVRAYNSSASSDYSNESYAVTFNIDENNNDNNDNDNTNNNLSLFDKMNPGDVKIVGSASNRGVINPDNGDAAQIYFKGEEAGKYECRIFTLDGEQLWHEEKTNVHQGIFNWDPVNMPSGGYVMYLKGPGIKTKKKIAILR